MKELPINIPLDVAERLIALSKETGRSFDELIGEMLEQYCDKKMADVEEAEKMWSDAKNVLFEQPGD